MKKTQGDTPRQGTPSSFTPKRAVDDVLLEGKVQPADRECVPDAADWLLMGLGKAIDTPPLRLDDLPMFATDWQIAQAIVGRENAERWMRERLPTLSGKPGFPAVDHFHGGRPVALVRRFYEGYFGIAQSPTAAPGRADPSRWKTKSGPRHQD